MGAVAAIIVMVFLALFFLPVYAPLLISFTLRGPDWREVRWCLRAATLVSMFIVLSLPTKRNEFGDDVAGNLAGAAQNFPVVALAVWGGGLFCGIGGWMLGLNLRARRERHLRSQGKPD